MIGTVSEINDFEIIVEPSIDISKINNLINNFVILKDFEKQLIGEIIGFSKNKIKIKLIGKYEHNKVLFGVSTKPNLNSSCFLIQNSFIPNIINVDDLGFKIGTCVQYDNIPIKVNENSFFGAHFAIFGSTGSGKSCGFSRIIQNLFLEKKPKNARFVIFDAYGEYRRAFENISSFKMYTTSASDDSELIKIPLWLLDCDDLALLLEANKPAQISIINKALRFVNVFTRNNGEAVRYKNSIIASNLLEIILSGRRPEQIRDQVLALLSKYHTDEINADMKIVEPGYTRTIKQCLYIDNNGKMQSIELVEKALHAYVIKDMDLELPDGSFKYTLNDLLSSLELALIDEGIWKSEETYDSINFLKIRLENLIKNEYGKYFDCEYVDKNEFIDKTFDKQITNFNISYVDDRFAKTITKIYTKLIFNYSKGQQIKAQKAFNIVLEEAHRYVQKDNDVDIIGYNIFERVCKEGRKYGVLMGFITQRPAELSETCLSQCSNFIIFKMIHNKDVEYIERTVPYITNDTISYIKTLSPGTAMCFGKSFVMPIITKFDMPVPGPVSEDANIQSIWYK